MNDIENDKIIDTITKLTEAVNSTREAIMKTPTSVDPVVAVARNSVKVARNNLLMGICIGAGSMVVLLYGYDIVTYFSTFMG